MDDYSLKNLINQLIRLPNSNETEWVEFKHDNSNKEAIGEYISAIANSARLLNRPNGYIVWGIDDISHDIVGTNFKPSLKKIGNQEFESWLAHLLAPRLDFRFYETGTDAKHIVILEIPAAMHTPVRFKDNEYIRVGSYKKKLKEYPEKERALWKLFNDYKFETEVAKPELTGSEALKLLDYPKYFELIELPLSEHKKGILERLEKENIIKSERENNYSITNLGAILFSKNLDDFPRLKRKAL